MFLFLEDILILLIFSFDLKIPKIIDDEILPVPINPKIMNDAE